MPNLNGSEWLIIILLLALLFGAKRLPDAARGIGRSLRIFKAETKGLASDPEPVPPVVAGTPAVAPVVPLIAEPVVDPVIPPAEQLPSAAPVQHQSPQPPTSA